MKKALKIVMVWLLCSIMVMAPSLQAHASIYEIVKAAIVKAIKAADLQIQRLQNKTIWLQNAQKVVENAMAKLKLKEIGEWTEKQREQYQVYFDELWKIKNAISYYQRIRQTMEKQIKLVKEYERAWSIVRSDKHFTAREIEYISTVYAGILRESLKNIEQITLVVQALKTQMSDAKRLEIVNVAADRVDRNYDDLHRFNRENSLLSLSRAKSEYDVIMVKRLYGLEK